VAWRIRVAKIKFKKNPDRSRVQSPAEAHFLSIFLQEEALWLGGIE